MPTYSKRKKKWIAKRKRGDRYYHLGYHKHPLSAVVHEIWFDVRIPRAYKNNNPLGLQGDRTLTEWRKSYR